MVTVSSQFTMDTNEAKAEFTSLIKRSVQYQCKYCVNGEFQANRNCQPGEVVPHPMNRGGVSCSSLRTRQISGIVVTDGFDVMMAKQNAVAVQVNPKEPDSFQKHFEGATAGDKLIVKNVLAIAVASFGSLTHSHLNCLSRNISAGMQGCDCARVADKRKNCKCPQSPILNKAGSYCIDLVEAFDQDWHRMILGGVKWMVLSYRMDIEEPEAARIISLADNKKHEAGMAAGHPEIFKAMVSLCVPNPLDGRIVPYEPVWNKMVEWY